MHPGRLSDPNHDEHHWRGNSSSYRFQRHKVLVQLVRSLHITLSTTRLIFTLHSGDSYTQTGFEIGGTAPRAGNPFGNPAYPGYTTAGGENWLDYVVTKLNKSSILIYNFAYGGATIDANLVKPYTPSVRSMTDQVGIFLNWNNGAGKGLWNSNNTMFSVWIGINDIGGSFGNSGDRAA